MTGYADATCTKAVYVAKWVVEGACAPRKSTEILFNCPPWGLYIFYNGPGTPYQTIYECYADALIGCVGTAYWYYGAEPGVCFSAPPPGGIFNSSVGASWYKMETTSGPVDPAELGGRFVDAPDV